MNKILKILNSKWPLKILTIHETEEVQHFLDLFCDFFQLCEGSAGSATELLEACPSVKNIREDKMVLGIYRDQILIGIIDLIQDYPDNGIWTIGYLLIHPKYQGKGIGSEFICDLKISLKNANAFKLRCVVQSQNQKSLQFWQRNSFVIEKEIQETLGKLTNQTFILEKNL